MESNAGKGTITTLILILKEKNGQQNKKNDYINFMI